MTSAVLPLAFMAMPMTIRCFILAGPILAMLSSCAQGTPAQKIIGGGTAPAGAYPFQVALIKTEAYGEGAFPGDEPLRALGCAGTLLSEEWVLTAAHCVAYRPFDDVSFPPPGCLPAATGDLCVYRPEALVVLAGTQELLGRRGKRIAIAEIIVNDGYPTAANEHDIALLRLRDRAAAGPFTLVADPAFTDRLIVSGGLARAIGWGLVDEDAGPNSVTLREIDLPVRALEPCRDRFRLYEAWVTGTSWADIDVASDLTPNMLCLGWDGPPPARAGKDYAGSVLPNVCYGDSGGFVGALDARGRWVQVGTPSWFKDCKTPFIYSVATNVAQYRSWIKRKTGLSLPRPAS